MRKEYWDINSNPSYRLNAVMETYCGRNSRHSLKGIEPVGYNANGELTGFNVCFEITEDFLNDGYAVETHKHADADRLIELRRSQGYEVYSVRINDNQTTVVSVKKQPMLEQRYSGYQR